jgi:zinc protease
MRNIIMHLFVLCFFWQVADADAGVKHAKLVMPASNVVHRSLPNGLNVYIEEDHRAPVVLASIWYRVGGSDEHNGITGLSHFLEHMMFHGTQQDPDGRLEKQIDRSGGYTNAFTTPDATAYFAWLPAKQLDLDLAWEADRMQGLLMKHATFKKEKQVVLEERRMRYVDRPQARAWLALHALAFVNNPYHHPVIGWKSDIEHLSYPGMMAWYRAWYQPNNATLVIVGDVQPKVVLAEVTKVFSALPQKPLPVLKPRQQAFYLGSKSMLMRAHTRQPAWIAGFNVPTAAQPQTRRDAFALFVLAESLVGGGGTGMLYDALVLNKKKAVSVGTSMDLYTRHPSLFVITATPAPGVPLGELQKNIMQVVRRIQQKPPTLSALKHVKTLIAAHVFYARDDLMGQARQIAEPLMAGMPYEDASALMRSVNAVSPEDLQRVAKRYLVASNRSVVRLRPIKAQPKERQDA